VLKLDKMQSFNKSNDFAKFSSKGRTVGSYTQNKDENAVNHEIATLLLNLASRTQNSNSTERKPTTPSNSDITEAMDLSNYTKSSPVVSQSKPPMSSQPKSTSSTSTLNPYSVLSSYQNLLMQQLSSSNLLTNSTTAQSVLKSNPVSTQSKPVTTSTVASSPLLSLPTFSMNSATNIPLLSGQIVAQLNSLLFSISGIQDKNTEMNVQGQLAAIYTRLQEIVAMVQMAKKKPSVSTTSIAQNKTPVPEVSPKVSGAPITATVDSLGYGKQVLDVVTSSKQRDEQNIAKQLEEYQKAMNKTSMEDYQRAYAKSTLEEYQKVLAKSVVEQQQKMLPKHPVEDCQKPITKTSLGENQKVSMKANEYSQKVTEDKINIPKRTVNEEYHKVISNTPADEYQQLINKSSMAEYQKALAKTTVDNFRGNLTITTMDEYHRALAKTSAMSSLQFSTNTVTSLLSKQEPKAEEISRLHLSKPSPTVKEASNNSPPANDHSEAITSSVAETRKKSRDCYADLAPESPPEKKSRLSEETSLAISSSARIGSGKGGKGGKGIRNRVFCGDCEGCLKNDDCGQCRYCRDKTKFGGQNRLRQKCLHRRCQMDTHRRSSGGASQAKPSSETRRTPTPPSSQHTSIAGAVAVPGVQDIYSGVELAARLAASGSHPTSGVDHSLFTSLLGNVNSLRPTSGVTGNNRTEQEDGSDSLDDKSEDGHMDDDPEDKHRGDREDSRERDELQQSRRDKWKAKHEAMLKLVTSEKKNNETIESSNNNNRKLSTEYSPEQRSPSHSLVITLNETTKELNNDSHIVRKKGGDESFVNKLKFPERNSKNESARLNPRSMKPVMAV